jgi:hypothetical protein
MAVLAKKSETRCKLCQHPRRGEIDALLEKRSNGDSDEAGRRFNEAYVLEILGQWGVVNPTPDNIKGHWKNHCELISSATLEAAQHAQIQRAREIAEGGTHIDVDENLRWLVTVGRAGLEEQLSNGRNPITVDHMLKATTELTRRAHNAAQHELLGELTGGIALALSRGAKELPPVEIIEGVEAEFVVVDD